MTDVTVPTSVTQYQTGFAPELAPYAQSLLGSAFGTVYQTATDAAGKPIIDPATGQPQITGFQPYQQYTGERYAQFTPLQQQAFAGAQAMQPSAQLSDATSMAGLAGLQALGTQYQPSQYGNFYQGVSPYQSTQFTAPSVSAGDLSTYQMGPAQQVSAQQVGTPQMATAQTGYAPTLQAYQMGPVRDIRTRSFAQPGSAEAYMSPYMQSVVGRQQQAAQREADIQAQTTGAQFAQAGAFGGGRFGVQQARAAEALARQKGDIQSQGLQAAYQQAQQQFNTEQQARLAAQQSNQQARLAQQQANLQSQLGVQQLGVQTGLQTSLANLSAAQQANVQNQAAQLQAQGLNAQQAMQAALANQQAGLTIGQQNLAAQLGVQQLGAQQGLQAALANQQAQMQAQQLSEQSQQYGYGQLAQQAGLGAQYGQAAAQLGEQSRQYGAGLGLQGLQTGLQAAQQLGTLGQTQFGQQQAINQLQQQYGAQQQQQIQNILGAQYQDFLNQQNYPYKQMGFMSDLLRGAPLSQTGTSVYSAAPTTAQTLTSLGLGAAGISSLLRKEGGKVQSYGLGGSVMSPGFKRYAVDNIDSRALPRVQQNAAARGDVDTMQAAASEMAKDAALRRGLAAAVPPGTDVVRAAGGGILAFNGDEESWVQESPGGLRVLRSEASDAADVDEDEDTVPKGPITQQDAARLYYANLARVRRAEKAYKPLTAQEESDLYTQTLQRLQTQAGPSPIADFLKKYEKTGEQSEAQGRQDLGTALLKASQAAVQPGGTVRGLAGAAATFGESYGAAAKERRKEELAMDRVRVELLDAQRKERMGLSKDAMAAVERARKNREDAARYNANALRLEADSAAKITAALRPQKPSAENAPKLPELLAAAELAFAQNPTAENQTKVVALRRAMAQARTSDIGPGRAGAAAATTQERIDERVLSALEDWKLMNMAYIKTKRTDPEKAAKMAEDQEKEIRKSFSSRSEASANPSGVIRFDSKGNVIPQ